VTAAALEVLMQEDRGLEPLFEKAIAAAIARDRSL
jgi:pyrroline-5-carboxylate reductase